MDLEQWLRLITNTILLIPTVMATTYASWLYLNRRQLYVLFGALALAEFVPLLLLRIAAIPVPPLLPDTWISTLGLILNAIASIFAMAWLVGLLRELAHVSKVRHGYFDKTERDE